MIRPTVEKDADPVSRTLVFWGSWLRKGQVSGQSWGTVTEKGWPRCALVGEREAQAPAMSRTLPILPAPAGGCGEAGYGAMGTGQELAVLE